MRKTQNAIRARVNVALEKDTCPDCFKVVGERSRYRLVCLLGAEQKGLRVIDIAKRMALRQPTITHHLRVLQSVNAVHVLRRGKEKIFSLNKSAHCFDECRIPFKP